MNRLSFAFKVFEQSAQHFRCEPKPFRSPIGPMGGILDMEKAFKALWLVYCDDLEDCDLSRIASL
jgi:hypothetical protein